MVRKQELNENTFIVTCYASFVRFRFHFVVARRLMPSDDPSCIVQQSSLGPLIYAHGNYAAGCVKTVLSTEPKNNQLNRMTD